jgi:hypothetical protein
MGGMVAGCWIAVNRQRMFFTTRWPTTDFPLHHGLVGIVMGFLLQ